MEKIITKKEVEQKLNETLNSLLLSDGFKLRKSDGFIIRKSQAMIESIFFRVLNYWPLCQEIDYIGFSIRFDRVEEIVNPFLSKYNFLNIAGTKKTSTIGDSIFFNIRIDKDEDINEFIYLYMNDIKEKILSYFKKNGNINDVNQYKKDRILTDNNGLNYIEHNLLQSITLMKLCNDPDFENLSQRYKELYASWGGQKETGFQAMDDLINYLSRR
jgi:hypothetical protein